MLCKRTEVSVSVLTWIMFFLYHLLQAELMSLSISDTIMSVENLSSIYYSSSQISIREVLFNSSSIA